MDGKKKIYYKPQRLKGFEYKGTYCYSLTICTFERIKYFKNKKIVRFVESNLTKTAGGLGFDIICYCFMPEHLHLLIQGKNDDSDLRKFVKQLKQTTGYELKKKTKRELWQKSFYDHITRGEEDLYNISRYILENPLRKSLVNDYREYPYSWCKYFDVKTGDPYL